MAAGDFASILLNPLTRTGARPPASGGAPGVANQNLAAISAFSGLDFAQPAAQDAVVDLGAVHIAPPGNDEIQQQDHIK